MTMTSPEAINPRKRSFESMNSEPDFMETEKTLASSLDVATFKPRKYQLKAFEAAMRQNTIVVLETGAGKTMIAVLLINRMALSMKVSPSRKVIVFLVPTVPLVHQQYEYIKAHTSLQVDEYFGGKGVDDWDVERWEKEVNEHDVLVMTPQVLLDALRKAYLNIEMVCLMIFDECHHATGNHPYSKIMKEFYDKSPSKPKIFGMTASPVIRKGVSSTVDSEKQISDLESLLNSKVFTTEDRTELEEVIPCAKEICNFYDPAPSFSSNLREKLESTREKCDTLLHQLKEAMPSQYKDWEDKFKELRKRLSGDHARILYCLDSLGLICAYEAVKICRENSPTLTEECELYRKSYLQCEYYLQEALSILKASLPDGALDTAYDCSKFVVMGYISPKLGELIQIFQSFGEPTQVMCLIFVERIIAAKVIERFVKRVSYLSHFTVSYLTGSNSSNSLAPKVQKETLELFRSGKVNLLFATDVVEEGIHVPNCSSVIRFDLPKTVRSYIQSRGRARQSNPEFIMMIERGNIKQRDQVFDLVRSEYSMIETAINRDPDAAILRESTVADIDTYLVDTTGASVTADASVNVINQYCFKLPRDKYFSPKPEFHFLPSEGLYQCQLTLPASAAFQTLVGPPKRNFNLAKQHVCFEACKKLHQLGALNDHLLPFSEDPSQNGCASETKGSASGAGTTKRKELHGTTSINALSGTWGNKQHGATFHAYGIHFSCSNPEELYSSFVLLIETKLDHDVGNVEMDLYLVSKSVKTSVSSYGEIHLDAEQVNRGMRFQEFFFNGLFGKLFIGSKSSKKGRKFLLQTDEEWDSSNMYLLLPLEKSDTPSCESWNINWLGVNSTVSTVNFLKKHAWLSAEQSTLPGMDSTEPNCNETSVIHLANKSVETNDLEEMVVMAIHTGRMYSILKFLPDTSAESPFDGNLDGNPSSFLSFSDYFNKKYGIVLKHPGQPLLLLKQSHNAHNLLVDFKKEATANKFLEAANGQQGNNVHMPPELVVSVDNVPIGLLKAFYLLPSVMQRLESLMLASQLRQEITCVSSNSSISSSMILEAITTLRCNECFSMERLELLGDSVLKYAVSCDLFLKYPKKHEGQLSSLRSWAVCNSTLHRVGIDRNLQGYIRDGAFDPRRWLAPGQRTIRPYPCSCGVDTLEVPVNEKFHTEDPKVVLGICCDKGHRWMGSKTISDCVEALIGAYYVDGGLVASLQLMKWLGINADLDLSLVDEAIRSASLHCYTPKLDEIKTLESKVGYEFSVKGLLLEAITHATDQEPGFGCSYERLEFLGDSVLDILITRYLYQTHSNIDPGELTDLRSASVNNESFAHAAVKRSLHPHLQHCSASLLDQITKYVKSVSCSHDMILQGPKVPKALGDMVESIAGAILIDTKLNLEEVWRVFEPLLSPIVTPDNFRLPPLRLLIEFCDREGYFLKDTCIREGDLIHAQLKLQLKDDLMISSGIAHNSKVAKARAAEWILKGLEERGALLSSRKRQGVDAMTQMNSDPPEPLAQKKQKIGPTEMNSEQNRRFLDSKTSLKISSDSQSVPVVGPINMQKGGPRTTLLELCKRLQWPAPEYSTTEHKSRTPIEFYDGPEMRTGFNSFISEIKLTIPNSGVESATGGPRADKKSSFDSAAVTMLHKLELLGKIVINGV